MLSQPDRGYRQKEGGLAQRGMKTYSLWRQWVHAGSSRVVKHFAPKQSQVEYCSMVQSLNTKALLTLASVVRRPGLMVPQVSVRTVSELNYTALRVESGIQAVIFDKDHTLTAPYANQLHPLAVLGLRSCLQVFGRERVAILSNSAGTNDDVDFRDAVELEEALGIPVIRHAEKKPGGLQEVLAHFGLTDPATICVVGDRLLTDIVFGNLHGMLTVHTLPFADEEASAKDNWTAKLLRPMENTLLYSDWFGGRALVRRRLPHKIWPGPEQCPLVLAEQSSDEETKESL
jgi:phosphatidylglycerophosphatase GEP4